MVDFDYSHAQLIKDLLYKNGFSMQKKFGQNFLINISTIQKISDFATNSKDIDAEIWEIGPGLGALTATFVKKGFKVKAFEIDKGFVQILKNKIFTNNEIEIVEGDVLKTLFLEKSAPKVLAGNLPYNISSVLIGSIIERKIAGMLPERMVFLLQKEVAERLVVKNDKDYSHLSFIVSLFYKASVPLKVGRGSFFPSPNVDSALIVLDKLKKSDENKSNFSTLETKTLVENSRPLFVQKRKTIFNNLKSQNIQNAKELLNSLAISENARIGELSQKQIIDLSFAIIK